MHFHGEERTYTGEADEEVCNCIQILRHEIEEAVGEGALTVADVGGRCGAGAGCGECHPEIARMLLKTLGPGLPFDGDLSAEAAVSALLTPLAEAIGAHLTLVAADAEELVLTVDGDDEQKQTVALWAELLVEPRMPPGGFVEVS